jgi:hypothetical protein
MNDMKFRKSAQRLLLLFLLLGLTSVTFGQQKRQPPRPARKVVTNSNAVASTATFETLLGSNSYKVYVEVRGVGQFIRSNAVDELLEPVMKLSGPPEEFRTLVAWLKAHADDVTTSRMFVAAWPTTKNVPDVLIAIEFDSPAEAAKFEPQLNTFLPKVLPTPGPEPSQPPIEGNNNSGQAESALAKPSYYLQQTGSLILITPTPLTLTKLRPLGSKLLTDDASFRVARNRFSAEQLFVYVDVNAIEKEQDDRRNQYEEEQKRIEEEAKHAAESQPSTTPETKLPESEPSDEVNSKELMPSPADQPSPKPPEPDPTSVAVGMLANSFFAGQTKWPDALGFGVSFESESFDVRALMITAPGEKCSAIPFFPNLVPGPPLIPESPSILPADTEFFATLSLDLPQIYSAMSKVPNESLDTKVEMRMVKDTELSGPFAAIEKQLKLKIKDDVLPLLGSEIVVSMPVDFLGTGPRPRPARDTQASAGDSGNQTTPSGPSFVIAISLRDKEGMRALLPRVVDSLGLKGVSALAKTERREDTEMVSYGDMFSYAFIGNFLVVSADAANTRHVVDSYLKHETLSSETQFKNYTRWQPRQLQAQVYVSPALMESYKAWADQPNALMSDQTREILSRLSVVAQPVTYSLSNDGLGILHELHVPKNLVLMLVTGMSAESNPSPMIANEQATKGALYMIAHGENQYRSGKGAGSFGTLEQLLAEGLVSKELIENHGYKIELTLSGSKFEVTAVPLEYGKTGKTSYYVDESNVLRGGDHGGGAATIADDPV